MTLKELNEYPHIILAIKRYESMLAELYDDSAGSMSPDMSGMPHGCGGQGSKVENGYIRNEKEIQELTEKLNNCRERLHKIKKFFRAIDDEQTLLIFELRFKNSLSWRQIAQRIGGNNTEDSVKKICYRHLDKYNSKKVYPDKSDTIIKTNKIKK